MRVTVDLARRTVEAEGKVFGLLSYEIEKAVTVTVEYDEASVEVQP